MFLLATLIGPKSNIELNASCLSLLCEPVSPAARHNFRCTMVRLLYVSRVAWHVHPMRL